MLHHPATILVVKWVMELACKSSFYLSASDDVVRPNISHACAAVLVLHSWVLQNMLAQILTHTALLVMSSDPTLSRGKVSGDDWVLPWLCRVSDIGFWISECLSLYDVALHVFHWLASALVWSCTISLAYSESILLTRHNQESAQWSPDPFPRERVGSGHETSKRPEE